MRPQHANVLENPSLIDESSPTMQEVFDLQRRKSLELRRSTAADRIVKLRRLRAAVLEHRPEIHAALHSDLRRPGVEVDLTEIRLTLQELDVAIRQLKSWTRSRRVSTPFAMVGTFSHVRFEPKGVCLVIAPWNFPFNLVMIPLVSAIAAGNTVIVKPSEFTPATSGLVLKILQGIFEPNEVCGFEGDSSISERLLDLPFDHIFFTGSSVVGKRVMAAAAKHLSSVTLELGGKSPVVVDQSADVRASARSVAFGKHQNAGQACIAPDHVYVHKSIGEQFVREYGATMEAFLGDGRLQHRSHDVTSIVSTRHAQRLKGLLEEAVSMGATVAYGGWFSVEDRYIQPTVLTQVSDRASIMQEEIFGPLLPVIDFSDVAEPIRRISAGPKPLALYIYSNDQNAIKRVIEETSAGTTGINTCVIQYAQPYLPFGGVNNSGIGRAHGWEGFKSFSNERAIIRNRFSPLMLFAPPYKAWVQRLAAFITRWI